MLVYEQMRLRLMQCKCPKSKPNTWGVTALPLKGIASRDSKWKTFKEERHVI
jgi:hypothetical protein